MSASPRHVLKRFYDAFASSSLEELVELFTEDAVFTYPELGWSHTVRGKPDIRSVMSELLGIRPPDFRLDVTDIADEGDGVRATWIGSTGGYQMHGEDRFSFRGECISELVSQVDA